MTRFEAMGIARAVDRALLPSLRNKIKAIHIVSRLHEGMLTIRVFSTPESPQDPAPFIFNIEEIN